MLKKTLKWFFIVLIGIILAGVLLPFVFKEEIHENLKRIINENVNASVDFKDISLSVFKDFPQLSVSVHDITVNGILEFENINLLSTSEASLSLPLKALFDSKEYEITKVNLDNPSVNILVLENQKANYDIIKTAEQESSNSSLAINLEEFRIKNGSLMYMDLVTNQKMNIGNINSHSSVGLENETLRTKTIAEVNDISYWMDGIKYLSHAEAKTDLALEIINRNDTNIKLKQGKLKLNEINLESSGNITLKKSEEIELDLDFSSGKSDFKDIWSLIPGVYTRDYADVKSSGSTIFEGKINGLYSENKLPSFDIKIKVNDGYIQYPEMPKSINDFNLISQIKSSDPLLKSLSVNISKFGFKLDNDEIGGKFYLNQTKVKGDIKGSINAANWKELIPDESIKQLNGLMETELRIDANIEDILSQNYEKTNLDGYLQLNDILVDYEGSLPTKIKMARADFDPTKINISSDKITYGKSDYNIEGNIENPLNIFTSENSKMNLLSRSKLIDLNEVMAVNSSTSETSTGSNLEIDSLATNISNKTLTIECLADKIIYAEYEIDAAKLKGNYKGEKLNLENLSMNINGNDLSLDGVATNVNSFLFSNDTLYGQFDFYSKRQNLNKYISEVENEGTTQMMIPIPERMNIVLDAQIDNVLYDKIDMTNLNGKISIYDQKAHLDNLIANSLGGQLAIKGVYDTKQVERPEVSVDMAFQEMKFSQAVTKIELFEKMVPISKYMKGSFNSTLSFSSALDSEMNPQLSSINAAGFLETLHGLIKDFLPIQGIFEKLHIKPLQNIKLENTKNWFEVKDGRVHVKPFNFDYSGINFDVIGSHLLDGGMDYKIEMKIPRKLLQDNVITGTVVSGLSFLEKEASSLGVNINQGENIDVLVNLTGDMQNPDISIKPLGSSGNNAQSQIKDVVTDKINDQTDKVKEEITEVTEEVKDSINTKINEEANKVKNKIDTIKKETIDTLKKEVIKKTKDVVDKTIPDSILDKGKDDLQKEAEKEIDKIKDKLGGWNPLKKKGG